MQVIYGFNRLINLNELQEKKYPPSPREKKIKNRNLYNFIRPVLVHSSSLPPKSASVLIHLWQMYKIAEIKKLRNASTSSFMGNVGHDELELMGQFISDFFQLVISPLPHYSFLVYHN